MKNILVTGGAGYIGSHIAEILLKKKFNVFIVDNLSTGYKKLINKRSKFYKIDITNFKKLKKIIDINKIDTVIHLAASISINNSQKNPKLFHKNNVVGTKILVKSCKNSHVKNFIFSSTAAVYKDTTKKVKESAPIKPKSIYGKTKIIAEKIIIKEFKKQKINYAILRYFNVVGASSNNKIGPLKKNDTLFKNLAMSLFKKKPLMLIYGNKFNTKDGTCVRDYIHVSDLSNLHFLILKKIEKIKKSVILNCGYGSGISVLKAVNSFIKFSKKKVIIQYKNKRPGDLASSTANNQKLKKFISWKPKYNNLKKIVLSCIKWEKKLN